MWHWTKRIVVVLGAFLVVTTLCGATVSHSARARPTSNVIAPNVPVFNVRTIDEQIDRSMGTERTFARRSRRGFPRVEHHEWIRWLPCGWSRDAQKLQQITLSTPLTMIERPAIAGCAHTADSAI
jgi:hypothetical protein